VLVSTKGVVFLREQWQREAWLTGSRGPPGTSLRGMCSGNTHSKEKAAMSVHQVLRSAVRDGVDLLFTINSKSIVLTSREAKALHSMLIKAQASNG